ncbi:LysM peptidoglycan-binding domain-containing protein [Streptomyces sp. NPDC002580]|uniref:LysM peptidoglycan-binding domain-containing protein n=1 Tax=Streptomyces sp. NPDC002580 TaxID=3364653 RepID=UPI00368D85CE
MRATRSPTAARRTAGRVLSAVLSLLTLVGAVLGLPLLLGWATPVIWASGHDDLAHLLDRQDTGSVCLLVLVAAGWIGWAQFTFCTLRELAAQLRGRRWHAPRGLGTSQRAAALLVGSILVLLPTGSALASDAQAATAIAAGRIPGHATSIPRASPAGHHPPRFVASTSASSPSYTVREARPAESLWSIAERELGAGERWREIADLNEGHTMAGGHVFTSSSFLQPGWTLAMPEQSGRQGLRTQTEGRGAVSVEKGERLVTVRSGDSLSAIAEDQLGDATAWPRLFEASRGTSQPKGLPAITDPDLIHPGQQVTVPGTRPRPGGPPSDRPGSDHDGSKAPAGAGRDGDDAPSATPGHSAPPTTAPAPDASAPSTPPTGSAVPEQPKPSSASPGTLQPAPDSGVLSLRTVAGAGALLAAAITAALALRRTLQRRRRTPGETIAIAQETAAAEAQLAAAGEPLGTVRLDVVLRTMARRADRDGREVPALRGARLDARTVHVLPEGPAAVPQAPFAAGAAGWWQLDPDAALLAEDQARTVPAPCPALVTVGSTDSGDLVLADLARLPALLLDGNPVHVTEVCTSLALELGMSPWAQDVEIVAVGFGEDLPTLLPNSRIAHMRQPAHALRDLTERLLEVHQMPETAHHPYVVLCASALDDDTAWQFADVLGKNLPIPVSLIAPAVGTTAGHFPEADILAVSAPTPQRFDPLGTDILVQRLEHAAYQQIVTALAVSGQPAHPAQGAWQHIPGEPAPKEQAVGRHQEPAVDAHTTPAPSRSSSAPAGTDADSNDAVFPALLQASVDPTALPPLSMGASSSASTGVLQASGHTGGADTAEPPATQPASGPVEDAESEEAVQSRLGPEIRVLGPVEVDGVAHTGHGPRSGQLAALLYFRPAHTADVLCAAMDPISPWSPATLNARLQGLRRALGNDEDGNPYVPRRHDGNTPYRLADGVRCDWTRFVQLAEGALPHGQDGLPDLEQALSLVRGRPFGTRPPAWAEPHQQEMITRIIDVAHTVATLRTPKGPQQNLGAARRAITTGLDVDEAAELLYRDLLVLESTAGNRIGLHTAISRIQQINAALDCSLETETEQLIDELLHSRRRQEPIL